jgi:hypothetical protein
MRIVLKIAVAVIRSKDFRCRWKWQTGSQRGGFDGRCAQRTTIGYRRHGAECADRTSLHRPPGRCAVYYGFVVLDDVDVDGFTLGKITDWEAEPCETGDAFVIAPDGSRAGFGLGDLRPAVLPRGQSH